MTGPVVEYVREPSRQTCWLCDAYPDDRTDGVVRGVVYEAFDRARVPLYVGRTQNFNRRMKTHRRSEWWPHADLVRARLVPCFEEAAWLELRLIREVRPVYNVQPSDNTLRGWKTRRARSVAS